MKRIYLCLAHMSGEEQKYIKEAFDTDYIVYETIKVIDIIK